MTDHVRTRRLRTQLGAPGPQPLSLPAGKPDGGGHHASAGTASLTLGTLREVRSELASLGDLMDRMSGEMAGLRRAVEAVAARGASAPDTEAEGVGQRASEKAARKTTERAAEDAAAREAALTARVDALERRVRKMKRRLDWIG